MCITLKNLILSTGENINYLGISIDPHLNFLNHIKLIEHKISPSIGIMYKLKPFLQKISLNQIYYAIIHRNLLHALPAWGSTYATYICPNYVSYKTIQLN